MLLIFLPSDGSNNLILLDQVKKRCDLFFLTGYDLGIHTSQVCPCRGIWFCEFKEWTSYVAFLAVGERRTETLLGCDHRAERNIKSKA